MLHLPEALAPLARYKQFLIYKKVPSKTRPGKTDKFPCSLNGQVVSAHDPAHWLEAAVALKTAQLFGEPYGVAFTFTANDPFFFVDIDDCLNPDGKTWSQDARELMGRLSGAAVEVSQSRHGLHIIGTGTAPEHGVKSKTLAADLFTEKRFVALTGTNAIGSAAVDVTPALVTLVTDHFPPIVATTGEEWTEGPVEGWKGLTDDAKLVARALKSSSTASTFGGTASFRDLWENNVDVLAGCYPDGSGVRAVDESKVDMALIQHLAFWTGKNCERILALMWKSDLKRDKWERDDYLVRTITKAVALQETVYSGPQSVESAAAPLGSTAGPELLTGYQFLGAAQQIEHFSGCVYIQDAHRVFTPSGSLLKPDQFNATYGGYSFQMAADDGGKTTRKAWEAFTESQAVRYPKAEGTCFRPQLPAGALIPQDGRILVNTYVSIETLRKTGDPAPFLNHLAKVLPVETDRAILLAYMAACVQHKGVKFQWAPLLQGCEGNGKTLFTRCVAAAIGERYTHFPPANEIAEKFNEWLFNRLFIGVEDVYVPEHKREVIEVLKPMITSDRYTERAMQRGQVTRDLCANFLLNSNHKDAIRKTQNDRRFAVFFTAQQEERDLARDGMAGTYFPKLYDWLRTGGYAVVTNYLTEYAIPEELNPAGACHRAPQTSSTAEAITASLGSIEQEILEAIDEGRIGFCGGWVSSMALARLLDSFRAGGKISHCKRREILRSIGYDWHPALPRGLVNNPIPLEGGRPRLYIKQGHICANLQTPAEVVRAYQEAQGVAVSTNKTAEAFENN